MKRFRAFISYSHTDQRLARKLHRKLESYTPPKSLRNQFTGRDDSDWQLKPVFLDREELGAASELSDSIVQALDNSAALIVVCSPAAVASRWVNQEISHFRTAHPDRPILAFIAAGDPNAHPLNAADRAAFPASLLLEDPADPRSATTEPLAADARKTGDGFSAAFLKLAAGLLGVTFDQLRQREARRQRSRWLVTTVASVSLTIAFAVIAWQAVQASKEAELARERAEVRLIAERETREFLISVFQLADPSEARGNQITVREVLDQAVARVDRSEFTTPLIKAKFLATMAEAYANLGLNRESLGLFDSAISQLKSAQPRDEARQLEMTAWVAKADVQFAMGDYQAAELSLQQLELLGAGQQPGPEGQVHALNVRGDLASYLEQDDQAMSYYNQALALLDSTELSLSQDASRRSRSLGGKALLAHFAGDANEAQRLYRQAVDLLVPVFGENHPDSIWAMTSLGSIAYLNGSAELAQRTWQRLLEVSLEVFDPDHPEIATLRNSLGLLAMEQGRFEAARADFEDAIRIDRLRRTERFDDLVYPLSNLALVAIFEGQLDEAEALLAEAREIMADQNHRWLGPTLARQAEVACLRGNVESGLQLAGQGVRAASSEFGVDDWRTSMANLTEQFCTQLNGEAVDDQAMDAYLETIIGRWGYTNCYSQRAIELAMRISEASARPERVKQLREQHLGW